MLLSNLNLLATAPDGVAKLRELILTLAVQGKLVPQDASDEPASVLLKKIRAEKDRLIAEGKIKRDKPLAEIAEEEKPFELPVGWEWVRLQQAYDVRDGTHDTPKYQATGYPLVTSKNIYGGVLDLSDVKLISTLDHAQISARSKVDRNDILFAMIGSIGNPVLVNTDEEFSVKNVALFKYYAASLSCPQYLLLVLRTETAGMKDRAAGGVQAFVSLGQLRSGVIALPPLAEQSRIVTRVEELMRLCDALQAKARLDATQHAQLVATLLATLTASTTPEALTENWHRVATHFDLLLDRPEAVDALEQTILQLAVRGLLVPQDPQDEPASQLLKKIRAEKDKLIAEDKIRIDKPVAPITEGDAPFGLPSKWEWVRIDDIAEVQGGIQKTQLRRPVKEHHPYLRVANVQRDALLLGEIERFELTKEELARWRLIAGDLLIVEGNGSADEVGRCAVWSGAIDPCVYQNHLIRVRCVQSESMAFIKLFLNAPSGAAEMKRLAITTSGLYNLSVGKIRNFVVPVPPLGEQSRIVARVASLRALCADLRQRLTTARAQQALLAQALVQDVAHS